MPDEYSDYEPVNSDQQGNDIALLPLEESAGGFRYRKELFIEVPLYLFDDDVSVDLTWQWTTEIRDSALETAHTDFESEVTWTARITAIKDPFFGTIGAVTWQPLGDGGSGKIETTIINGSDIDPTTAWQYVDTPTPTVNSEMGFTVFTPEGVITADSITFFAVWFSPKWLLEKPFEPGYILDANDSTSIGSIQDESTYFFSFKAAGSGSHAIEDARIGARWLFYRKDGKLLCAHSWKNDSFARSATDAVIYDGNVRTARGLRWGATLYCVLEEQLRVRVAVSYDEGLTWSTPMIVASNVNLLGAALSPDGGTLYLYLKATANELTSEKPIEEQVKQGEAVRVLVHLSGENIKAEPWQKVKGVGLPTSKVAALLSNGNVLTVVSENSEQVRVHRSTDELASLKEL